MPALYEFPSQGDDLATRVGPFFRGLSCSEFNEFVTLAAIETCLPGTILYEETQEPSYVWALLEGRVKLRMDSCFGKRLVVRVARRGELLGLTEVLSGNPFELTAESECECKIAAVHRDDFCRFVRRHPSVFVSLSHDIGRDYKCACERLRMVGLASLVQNRLARFLLDKCGADQQTQRDIRLHLTLTRREIGEYIGASRETISRALGDLQRLRLVHLRGPILTIPSSVALAHYADVHARIYERKCFSGRTLLSDQPAACSVKQSADRLAKAKAPGNSSAGSAHFAVDQRRAARSATI